MALRDRRLADRVLGIPRRAATIAEALAAGAIDEGTLDVARVAEADLVVLASPVLAIPPLVAELAPRLRPGTIVTDVGSTKAELLRSLEPLIPLGVDLVGGHPMAGSERGGVLAGRADLFKGAVYVLTRSARCGAEAMGRMTALVRAIGATPVEMDAAPHDDAVARISHLPHVVAAALAEATAAGPVPAEVLGLLVAGGFRSTTRIASSPPEMWRDICLTNREAILAALDDFDRSLAEFRAALAERSAEGLLDAFSRGKATRDALVPPEHA